VIINLSVAGAAVVSAVARYGTALLRPLPISIDISASEKVMTGEKGADMCFLFNFFIMTFNVILTKIISKNKLTLCTHEN